MGKQNKVAAVVVTYNRLEWKSIYKYSPSAEIWLGAGSTGHICVDVSSLGRSLSLRTSDKRILFPALSKKESGRNE